MKLKKMITVLMALTLLVGGIQVPVSAAVPAESDWSEWSTVCPESKSTRVIETKTQYSYRTKDTKTYNNASATYNGYTRDTSVSATYGSWSSWQKTAITATNILDVKNKTVTDYYNNTMAHYCTGNVAGARYQTCATNQSTNATFNAKCTYHTKGVFKSTDMSGWTVYDSSDGSYIYGTTKDDCYRCSNTCFRFYIVKKEAVTHKEYASRPIYYTFYKWSDWSAYSDTAVTASSAKEVRTQTLYRYVDYEGTINMCTVTLPDEEYTYTGSGVTPVPVVTNKDGEVLTPGVDYNVKYQNNVNAGTAYANIEGITDEYFGTQSVEFAIGMTQGSVGYEQTEVTKRLSDDGFINPLEAVTDGKITYASSDPGVASVDENTGYVTYNSMGDVTITATAADGTNYKAAECLYTLHVIKAAPVLFFGQSSIICMKGNKIMNTLTNPESALVRYSSSDESVATVSNVGVVEGIKKGQATITATAYEDGEAAATDSYTVTVEDNSNDSVSDDTTKKTVKVANTIKGASKFTRTYKASKQTFRLSATALGNAKLSYSSNNAKVTVNSAGTVTIKAKFIGKATIKITSAGTDRYKKTTKSVTVTVNPKKPAIKKVTSPSSATIVTSWGKVTPVTKYQIQFSLLKNFANGKKTSDIRDISSSYTRSTLNGFPSGKWYVRLRCYKTVSGTKYYSEWSTMKNVTVR